MLFPTFQFAIFLAALLSLLAVSRRAAWNPLLLAASLLFYALWIPSYLPLLLLEIGVNYALVRGIAGAAPRSRERKLYLTISIVFTLALLAAFKYAAFAIEAALPVLRTLAIDLPIPEILLPLGISFYSFQIISLSVDTYRGDGPEIPSLGRYALYISFFPQLIAGPILRGSELLPQLAAGAAPSSERTRRGLWLIALGLLKKVVLADFLLAPFVDSVFGAPGLANARFHWIALFGFSFQIYFDFAGYTDMARGIALLLGFELPENFREPYLSRSPQEFWQRWHITLTRWLRLYLFTPLSRALMRRAGRGFDRAMITLAQLATMTLCGLWHGAGWNFVIWGALQGLLLVVWRIPRRRAEGDTLQLRDAPKILFFYTVFCLTLVFFRSPDLASALEYFQALFSAGSLPGWPRLAGLCVLLCALLHVAERVAHERSGEIQAWLEARPWGAFAESTAFGVLVGVSILVAGVGGEFIYFQF